MKITEMFDYDLYNEMLDKKYIREQTHPDFPELVISNYTETCTWEKVWNEVTLSCRGLIWNQVTGEVVARPLTKFFNHDQEGAPTLTLDTPVMVTEKMDGSMGILYQTPDGMWAIATRGSFASDQALWATKFYNDNYADIWEPVDGFTYIFEIIYPENRIVVDYGDKQGLVLLGKVNKRTGRTRVLGRHETLCPTEVVEVHEFRTYGEVIASDQRSNREGFVLWNPEADWRVKIKHEEYVYLHRLLTGTNKRDIWIAMSEYEDLDEIFADAPDEFHEWIKVVSSELRDEFFEINRKANKDFRDIRDSMVEDDKFQKKELASRIESYPNKGLIFKLWDRSNLDSSIWKMIKPRGDEKMVMKPVDQDSN